MKRILLLLTSFLITVGLSVSVQSAGHGTLDKKTLGELYYAISFAKIDKLKQLLKSHGSLAANTVFEDGDTPLTLATLNQSPEVIKLLLDAGANKDVVDKEGKNALYYATTPELEHVLKNYIPTKQQEERKIEASVSISSAPTPIPSWAPAAPGGPRIPEEVKTRAVDTEKLKARVTELEVIIKNKSDELAKLQQELMSLKMQLPGALLPAS